MKQRKLRIGWRALHFTLKGSVLAPVSDIQTTELGQEEGVGFGNSDRKNDGI